MGVNPAGLCGFQAMPQWCSLRARGNTPSHASSRLIVDGSKGRWKALGVILRVIDHPWNLSQKLACLTYGVQSSTVTVIASQQII